MITVLRALGFAFALLAACGRIGFDPGSGGGSGDGGNGDGGGGACTPAPETCNGIDDDCDMLIDEGCPCTPFTITRAVSVAVQAPPAVWTGGGYVLVYAGAAGSLLAEPIDGSGNSLGNPNAIGTPSSGISEVSAAYTGQRVAVAWPDPGSIVWLGTDASVITAPQPLGSQTSPLDHGPFLAWSGAILGVAYHDTITNQQVLARYTATGGYGGEIGGSLGDPLTALDWYGTGFVMSQASTPNPRNEHMGTFDANGQLVSTSIAVSGNRTGFRFGRTTGAGGVLGSAWVETSGLWIEPHDAAGIATAPPAIVEATTTQSFYALSVVWTGVDYVLATTETETMSYVHVFHATATGATTGAPLTLPMPPSSTAAYAVLLRNAAAGRLVVTWTQNAAPTGYELYVVQLCY